MIQIQAPAKLNLTLEVLARRGDGYHEIRSVIQAINMCDRLAFQPERKLAYKCDAGGWLVEKSLVARAAELLQKESGYSEGATIDLEKHIPLMSGLGGDSSDAAAVLSGLNRLWGLEYPPGELVRLAGQLGSDVAFFLTGGTALMQGHGEEVSPLPSLPQSWVVLLMPDVPRTVGKTGKLYKAMNKKQYTQGQATEEMVALLTRGDRVAPQNLYNVFDSVAYDAFEGLGSFRRRFIEAGAHDVHLAGSGPALFSLFRDKTPAEDIYSSLKRQGLQAYLARTLAAGSHPEQMQ
jgi:4-diphosphocytidyl-2-C-methyl-D-erythritol kinase